uniref:ATP-binding protein n=1 Tax=Sphingomonas sp. H160509 TaxID=2955313 RepID=UPI0031586087
MEAVGQLTGGIAHDFNNMLAVVLGGLELARRNLASDPASVRRHIDSATEGANRAAALTRRLLAFSREDSLKAETIDAAALVSGMSDLLDRTLGDAITVIVRDDAVGGCVRADRVQLENAVLNLAVNARDAMNGRGTLTVATGTITLAAEQVGRCAAGDYVTIMVGDDGCGMAPDVAERVFEPFFTTKEVGKGTGLGLSQIFALVQQLHGEVGIVSAPGEGTTVTLYFPRAAELVATPLPTVPIAMVEPIAPTMPETLQILVVEDDPRVLAATTGALEEIGHHPIACDDPLAAPALLAANPGIGLIISDVLMPRQTGPEMIAALSPLYPHVAVLFVTGFAGEVNVAQFGGHEVLRKPFTLNGLERAVMTAMATERRETNHPIAAE